MWNQILIIVIIFFYSIMVILPSGQYVLCELHISWYGLNITLVYVKHEVKLFYGVPFLPKNK